MKLKTLCCLFLITFAVAFAPVNVAAQGHAAAWSCTASPTPGVTGYNFYRALCSTALDVTGKCPAGSEGAFTKLTAVPVAACAYTDSTPVTGSIYSYYATATAPNTLESVPSVHNGASFVVITPPGQPIITSLTMTLAGKKTTVIATWTAPKRVRTTWLLIDAAGKQLASGAKVNKKGEYRISRTIRNLNGAPTFTVCDVSGCVSRTVG